MYIKTERGKPMKKSLALFLTFIMVLGLLPSVAFAVGDGRAIQSSIKPIEGGQKSSIWFGNYEQSSDGPDGFNKEPIKWRALTIYKNYIQGRDDVLLVSDQNLDVQPFHKDAANPVAWKDSDLCKWMNGDFKTAAFSIEEQSAMVNALNDAAKDKIFALSNGEVGNGGFFPSPDTRKATNTAYVAAGGSISASGMQAEGAIDRWWLRDKGKSGDDYAAYADVYGSWNVNGEKINVNMPVRPALRMASTMVIFSSAAMGGKPGGGLNEVPEYMGNEWKLTLKDNNRAGFSVLSAYMVGDSLKISYNGAKTGTNEYISVVVMDNNGSITHYWRSASSLTDENGVATIKGMTAMQEGRTLYAFNEQYNGDKKTDYASELKQVTIGDAPTVTEFTKARLTATPMQGGFDAPNNMAFNFEDKVIFTDNAPKANLLYSFTVKGTPRAEVGIKDDGAKLFYMGNWVDSPVTVTLPAAEQGENQAELTLYGYKEFSSGDINGGMLKNTAKATAAASSLEASAEVAAEDKTTQIQTITIEVSKTWHDDSGTVEKPDEITVLLLADGKEDGKANIKYVNGAWSHSFGVKPANDNGKPINYTVKEEDVSGWTPYYYTVGPWNNLLAFQIHNVPTEKTREIKVTKNVSGEGAEKEKYFDFKVTLLKYHNGDMETPFGWYKLGGIHTFGGVTFTNGETTFKLKDGESFTITGIPSDFKYEVEEIAPSGYTVKVNGSAGNSISNVFTDAKTVNITFENVKKSGDSGGHGHYHPSATPVPVMVIPPKTGDMTIWQSILHFLGIR